MATSNSTDFILTRDQIINGALRIVGALAQGESPTADMVTEAAEALNIMVKAWAADGMPLWAIKETTVPLTATAQYQIGLTKTINTAKPLKIIQAFVRDTTSDVDVPMTIVTKDEYNRLGNKTSTGTPIQLYYEPLLDYGIMYVYPLPDTSAISDKEIHIFYQRPFQDFDASTDNPDFPQEWYDALKFGLADRIAVEYGVPIVDRNDIKSRAMQLKNDALSFGTEEGSLYFQRDYRNW